MDEWAEPNVATVKAALGRTDRPWWIAGGIALDLFLNRTTRSHHDVDVVVLQSDVVELRRSLATWEVFAAVGWEGAPRESRRILRPWLAMDPLPDHGAYWCRPGPGDPWCFELLVNPGTAGCWTFKRDESLQLPFSKAAAVRDGVPFLAPEIVLLHKATSGSISERDDSDLLSVIGEMTPAQSAWLAKAISRYSSRHPWLSILRDG